MAYSSPKQKWGQKNRSNSLRFFGFGADRLSFLMIVLLLGNLVIIGRLFKIQVMDYGFYSVLAANEHEIYKTLSPKRGEIYVRGNAEEQPLIPLVTNQSQEMLYAIPKFVEDPEQLSEDLAEILDVDEENLLAKLSKEGDPYEPIKRRLSIEEVDQVQELDVQGLGFIKENWRYYVQGDLGAQVLGFVGFVDEERRGLYGVEGHFDEELAGVPGELVAEKDVAGRWIALTEKKLVEAQDGSDIVLTLDKSIQFVACDELAKAAVRFAADSGSVTIMDPKTGRILAMCTYPSFDPNDYSNVDSARVYNNNATFDAYEPGSIFKPITMAIALDQGKVTPNTTYEDTGLVKIDIYDIQNSDKKAHGIQTMVNVLEKSLNTGVIFASDQVGLDTFRSYVHKFGFGEKTGIQLDSESSGNIKSLDIQNSPIYLATASFGQGITVTPIQMVQAFGAFANEGVMMKPYIVDEIIHSDGSSYTTSPEEISQVVSSRTAALLNGMMVSVVKNGHAGAADVPGYYVAGKTGTAQVAERGEYRGKTVHSFIGFAPVDDPKFVMLTRLDNPKNAEFSSSTAAPLFGDIAKFLMQYYQIPPEFE